jgi:hypothetical protein
MTLNITSSITMCIAHTLNTSIRKILMSDHTENGNKSRTRYLEGLAKIFKVPLDVVHSIAELHGPDEDFDGLLTALDDYIQDED